MLWLAVGVAFFALLGIFTAVDAGLRAWSDRRWDRMMRNQDRRELRLNTWAAIARLRRFG